MFVEYIYMCVCVCEQYNPETARQNTLKLKHFILIDKTKHLLKWNWQPWFQWSEKKRKTPQEKWEFAGVSFVVTSSLSSFILSFFSSYILSFFSGASSFSRACEYMCVCVEEVFYSKKMSFLTVIKCVFFNLIFFELFCTALI
jgi:hypothetical protein